VLTKESAFLKQRFRFLVAGKQVEEMDAPSGLFAVMKEIAKV
jgi:hypothetical protein